MSQQLSILRLEAYGRVLRKPSNALDRRDSSSASASVGLDKDRKSTADGVVVGSLTASAVEAHAANDGNTSLTLQADEYKQVLMDTLDTASNLSALSGWDDHDKGERSDSVENGQHGALSKAIVGAIGVDQYVCL